MSSCHLLFLDTTQLAAFAWKKGKLEAAGMFIANDAGYDNFASYLADHRHDCFHLLANLPDEGYASESIPCLWGNDRQALIARKARQHFAEPALSCVVSLGREKTTRKNENLLISALTAPEQFAPWLHRIKENSVALSGIYSTSQLGGQLLAKLGHSPPDCLLLCQFENSLRESYLNNGHSVFSRLIALSDSNPPAITKAFVAEATRLHQYLIGQRRIARDGKLPIFILAHPQAITDIEQACAAADKLVFCIIDNHAAARRLKLKNLPADSCCAQLFLQLLAGKRPRQQFAGPELRQDFRLAKSRRLIWGLGFGMLAMSGLNAAHTVHQTRSLREESAQLMRDEIIIQREHQTAIAGFPKLDIDHDNLRRLIERHDELAQQRVPLASSLFMLGRVLDQLPEIEVDDLDWRSEKLAPGARARMTPEVITLNGHLAGTPGSSVRQAQASLEQFNERLQASANCRAEIAGPLIATSAPDTGDNEEEDDTGPLVMQHFSLRISCRK
jgi:hypothetical protein